MRIGYFLSEMPSISETFISDLIRSLNKKESLRLFTGLKNSKNIGNIENIEIINTGFYQNYHFLHYKIYKLLKLFFNDPEPFKLKLQKFIAFNALNKLPINILPEVAYIEYLHNAIFLQEFLTARNIPFVVHVHGVDITAHLNNPHYRKELKVVFKKVKLLIVASEHIKRLCILEGCDEFKIKVIRLGVESSGIEVGQWSTRLNTNPKLIFCGRLTQKKNPIALLYMLKKVMVDIPTATLTIIGDGPLKNELYTRIKYLGLERNVSLLGAMERNMIYNILNNHWVYVQHSVTAFTGDQEGFAISIAEAALQGLPIVSTLHNGIPENVIDGVTGFLVPEYNYELMAERVIYLIKNPSVAEKMGKEGRKHILNLCNQVTRTEHIYNSLNSLLTKK